MTLDTLLLNPLLEDQLLNRLAFCIKDKEYTYSEFFDYVEQIYTKVKDLPETNIGLYTFDDIRTYASILALWYAGKAYVPLNPMQPTERHKEIMESVGSAYTLSCIDDYDMGLGGAIYIYTSSITHQGYTKQHNIAPCDYLEDTLAYILFTSGSTGKPKGVPITRGNVAAFVESMEATGLKITADDRCMQPFDLTFDMSVSSYVMPLYHRASIYTIPQKVSKFIYISQLLEDYHLTVLQMVPSMIRNLLPYMDEVDLSSVRYNILAGETLTVPVIQGWHKANPEMISYNMYGPTEDTIYCTYYEINKHNIDSPLNINDAISIGKTFINNDLLILDDNNNVIDQPNVEGELCLSGRQLTPGYWKNDKENTAKFFDLNGQRYYRSGDLCFYAEDGNIQYIGRTDFQVKINGFRVELGEIESRYREISNGRYSVVMPYTNEQGGLELAIIIEGAEYDTHEHKAELANVLPPYEVPAKWLFINAFPLNMNGKIDRKQLKSHFNL